VGVEDDMALLLAVRGKLDDLACCLDHGKARKRELS
jgi:hypothetical protein